MEIKDLDGTLKAAELGPRQRRALLMRAGRKNMSRKNFNEWRRAQRAIKGHSPQLVKAIAAAVKKRVIKAPLLSGGSYSGVIREGAGYTRPLPDEETAKQNSSRPKADKWFQSTPPPISRILRKTKHLFKKVSK